ncbi:hypothetical protein BJF90_42195 [Pseudonocardia sp. CNS-004]|nr:hypothetical protein BJF90_42195 [Pseudonocardia sp. CNS-004]
MQGVGGYAAVTQLVEQLALLADTDDAHAERGRVECGRQRHDVSLGPAHTQVGHDEHDAQRALPPRSPPPPRRTHRAATSE